MLMRTLIVFLQINMNSAGPEVDTPRLFLAVLLSWCLVVPPDHYAFSWGR